MSPRWPTPRRPPSPTGASPDKPITLSDASSEQLATPTIQDTASRRNRLRLTRQSLRIQAQGGVGSILGKAKKRIRAKGEGSTTQTSIPLVTSFPFRRLTIEQIDELFQIYHIHLGHHPKDKATIITTLQTMDRAKYELLIKDLLDQTKSRDKVIVDKNFPASQVDTIVTS